MYLCSREISVVTMSGNEASKIQLAEFREAFDEFDKVRHPNLLKSTLSLLHAVTIYDNLTHFLACHLCVQPFSAENI